MGRRTEADKASRQRVSGGLPTKRGDRQKTKFGFRAEDRLADRLGARKTTGSGNKSDKGDMVIGTMRIESKSTLARSITIELQWLQKIGEQATRVGHTPALALQFVNEQGRVERDGCWIAVPEQVFSELIKRVADAEEDPDE